MSRIGDWEDLHWGLSDAEIVELHEDCAEGTCGKCDGQGEHDCRCYECGDDHSRDCEHCAGTGKCQWNDPQVKARVERAASEWRDYLETLVHPATPEGFAAAYRQMFGHDAKAEDVTRFTVVIAEMAKRAGVRLR